MKNLDPRRQRWMRARIMILAALTCSLGVAVLRRAWHLQIDEGPELRAQAEHQQLRDVRIAAQRGTIFDRHGAELAVSVPVASVFANPRQMHHEQVDLPRAADQLTRVLGVDRDRILRRLESDRYFVWIERQVTPEEAEAVRELNIPGLAFQHEPRRFYPNRELAAHVLGFANIDGVGIEGLELALEERLKGSSERVQATYDRRGRIVFSEHLLDDRATQGDDVYLTIDKTLQHLAEQELALAVRTVEANAGSVVVLDPNSGEILAMANYPTFDANEPGRAPAAHRRNRAVTDRFEPGSTVKPFTIAAALAAGAIRSNQRIDCLSGGRLVVDEEGHTIGDQGHRFGSLTPAEILAHSSNIGAARIGIALGREGLYRGLRRFGFGEPTGLPLPGETGGILRHHRRWYGMDHATISFGQGLSITSIQLATAMATVANGGRLMRPTLIHRVVDARGEIAEEGSATVRRQVVPRATARLVADMLTGVTGEEGTGIEAAIDGYLVAGKTGTAQKADYARGGYADGKWVASFVGFVPADAPRLVISVVIDEPVIDHYGGVVAGPVFRRVGEAALRHLGVPSGSGGEALVRLARERRRARAAASNAEPEPTVALPEIEVEQGQAQVPELHGLDVRRALTTLVDANLLPQFEGTGRVVSQTPTAGVVVDEGTTVRAILEAPVWDAPDAEDDDPDAEPGASHGGSAVTAALDTRVTRTVRR